MGAGQAELVRWAGRFAARARTIVGCALAGLAPVAFTGGPVALGVGIGLVVLLWQLTYFWACSRVPLSRVVLADAVVLAGVGCLVSLMVDTSEFSGGGKWLAALVSFSLIAYQWQVSPLVGGAAALLAAAGYLTGGFLSTPGHGGAFAPEVLWFLVQALLSGGLLAVIRRGAVLADDLATREAAEHEQAAVSAARRTAERGHLAVLHDTAAATLLMVGSGVFQRSTRWLRRQASRDLQVLDGARSQDDEEPDLVAALVDVASRAPVRVRLIGPSLLRLPATQVAAVCGGIGEALCNVGRHAHVDHAVVTIGRDHGGLWVQVRDHGCGFDPADVAGPHRGLTNSIRLRLRDVGGNAAVRSTPGIGTSVTLRLPPDTSRCDVVDPPRVNRLARMMPKLLLPRLQWSVLVIAMFGMVVFHVPVLLMSPGTYRPQWLMIAALALLVIGVAATVFTLVAGVFVRWRWFLLTLVLATVNLGAITVPGQHLLGAADWTYLVGGMLIIALLVDRPFKHLGAVLCAHNLLSLIRALLLAPDELMGVVGLICALVNSFGLQLALAVGTQKLSTLADRADAVLVARERVRLGRAVGTHVHRDRQQRYADLSRTAAPLLRGLATGTLSPDQQSVQRDCAVEAARMRRLFAEGDDVVDPMTHELRACAEVAERCGVAVHVVTGEREVEVPKNIRRALTEPVLALLTVTCSRAKITVTEHDGAVIVSAISDVAHDDTELPLPRHDRSSQQAAPLDAAESVTTKIFRSGRTVWITACWAR